MIPERRASIVDPEDILKDESRRLYSDDMWTRDMLVDPPGHASWRREVDLFAEFHRESGILLEMQEIIWPRPLMALYSLPLSKTADFDAFLRVCAVRNPDNHNIIGMPYVFGPDRHSELGIRPVEGTEDLIKRVWLIVGKDVDISKASPEEKAHHERLLNTKMSWHRLKVMGQV